MGYRFGGSVLSRSRDVVSFSPKRWNRWLAILWQMSVILFLDQIYEIGRGLIPADPQRALTNAADIIHWENTYHIFMEPSIQHFWLGQAHSVAWFQITPHALIDFLNLFYLYAHFLGTSIFLIWLYLRRRDAFGFVRDVLFTTTAIALVIYIVFPTAPPRLVPARLMVGVPYRFQDILALWLNPHEQGISSAYNPYAAMPSLHFAWALVVGVTLAVVGRRLALRVLGPMYVCVMLATIVITANHFILDAVGSVIVVSAATALVWLMQGFARGRNPLGQNLLARMTSAL